MKKNPKSLLKFFVNPNKVVRKNLLTLVKHIVENESDVLVVYEEINDGQIVKLHVHINEDDVEIFDKNERYVISAISFWSNWYGVYYFYEISI